MPRPSRRQDILEALARELETHPGERITTASLARAVGVSEAALYRHFASKARMFEALIEFAEETVFGRINELMERERDTRTRVQHLLSLLLGFAERNPGITRVLLGGVLVGEHERLLARTQKFFDRLESQLRQVLRESGLRQDVVLRADAETGAALLLAYVEGRMQRFLRSQFKTSPAADLRSAWPLLSESLFEAAGVD